MKKICLTAASTIATALVALGLSHPALGDKAEEDFSRAPDAVIATKSLSSLPKDIISIPILKDLLSEDFVFYYRDSGADWLSFRGALARLAFEEKSDWPTNLLAWLTNGPAEIALWKGADGKLNHFMAVVDQTGVKAMFEAIADATGKTADTQLTIDKDSPVLTLNLATDRKVYLAHVENRLFLFSDPKMSIPANGVARSVKDRVKSFFGANDNIGVFAPKIGQSTHVVTVSAQYLSFGYQAFFADIKDVQFEFNAGGWQSRILTGSDLKLAEASDWSQMPRGAAFCAAAPMNKKKIETLVKLGTWLEKSGPTAVACWYPGSKFYAPLLAVHGNFIELMKHEEELKSVFSNLIGSREAIWSPAATEGGDPILHWKPKLPVTMTKTEKQIVLSREVGGRYGIYPAKSSKAAKQLGSYRFFRVQLAVTPETLLFSPDDHLLERGLTTVNGKFPSMAAQLANKGAATSFVLVPDAFSKLAKEAITESLPNSREAIFRSAVGRHLFPNLEKFGKRPLQAANIGASLDEPKGQDGLKWKKIEWTVNASR